MRESFEEGWRLRFGGEPPKLVPDLAPLIRHRSVRRYQRRPIEEELVASLVGVAQSAATSSNLQLWSVLSVQDHALREEIAKVADNYAHIRAAPWFFAFLVDHFRLKEAAEKVGEQALGLDYQEFFIMAVIDAALAAERFVCAAETLGLGICYIGAMRNNAPAVKELLAFPEHVFCPFGLCLGWPDESEPAHIKPRLRQDVIWHRERYQVQTDVEEYDVRMKQFYAQEHMKGEVTWSMRSGRRVDNDHLTGREILGPWLKSQGFNMR